MDWAAIANAFFGVLLTVFGWVMKTLWDAVSALRKDLSALEVKLPEVYVRKDDMREMMADLKAVLSRIEEKLDGKADKTR